MFNNHFCVGFQTALQNITKCDIVFAHRVLYDTDNAQLVYFCIGRQELILISIGGSTQAPEKQILKIPFTSIQGVLLPPPRDNRGFSLSIIGFREDSSRVQKILSFSALCRTHVLVALDIAYVNIPISLSSPSSSSSLCFQQTEHVIASPISMSNITVPPRFKVLLRGGYFFLVPDTLIFPSHSHNTSDDNIILYCDTNNISKKKSLGSGDHYYVDSVISSYSSNTFNNPNYLCQTIHAPSSIVLNESSISNSNSSPFLWITIYPARSNNMYDDFHSFQSTADFLSENMIQNCQINSNFFTSTLRKREQFIKKKQSFDICRYFGVKYYYIVQIPLNTTDDTSFNNSNDIGSSNISDSPSDNEKQTRLKMNVIVLRILALPPSGECLQDIVIMMCNPETTKIKKERNSSHIQIPTKDSTSLIDAIVHSICPVPTTSFIPNQLISSSLSSKNDNDKSTLSNLFSQPSDIILIKALQKIEKKGYDCFVIQHLINDFHCTRDGYLWLENLNIFPSTIILSNTPIQQILTKVIDAIFDLLSNSKTMNNSENASLSKLFSDITLFCEGGLQENDTKKNISDTELGLRIANYIAYGIERSRDRFASILRVSDYGDSSCISMLVKMQKEKEKENVIIEELNALFDFLFHLHSSTRAYYQGNLTEKIIHFSRDSISLYSSDVLLSLLQNHYIESCFSDSSEGYLYLFNFLTSLLATEWRNSPLLLVICQQIQDTYNSALQYSVPISVFSSIISSLFLIISDSISSNISKAWCLECLNTLSHHITLIPTFSDLSSNICSVICELLWNNDIILVTASLKFLRFMVRLPSIRGSLSRDNEALFTLGIYLRFRISCPLCFSNLFLKISHHVHQIFLSYSNTNKNKSKSKNKTSSSYNINVDDSMNINIYSPSWISTLQKACFEHAGMYTSSSFCKDHFLHLIDDKFIIPDIRIVIEAAYFTSSLFQYSEFATILLSTDIIDPFLYIIENFEDYFCVLEQISEGFANILRYTSLSMRSKLSYIVKFLLSALGSNISPNCFLNYLVISINLSLDCDSVLYEMRRIDFHQMLPLFERRAKSLLSETPQKVDNAIAICVTMLDRLAG